ncbi:MAG: hydrolase/acyltransferase [Paenibacillaceae bacterium]|nr:hydrolase/acyltransferase [Paenibacillaceae bacterium]
MITHRVILVDNDHTVCVAMPEHAALQLIALHLRLDKEVPKLQHPPKLLRPVALCTATQWLDASTTHYDALTYVAMLLSSFTSLRDDTYPLIALCTEIRALLAQLEQWE